MLLVRRAIDMVMVSWVREIETGRLGTDTLTTAMNKSIPRLHNMTFEADKGAMTGTVSRCHRS